MRHTAAESPASRSVQLRISALSARFTGTTVLEIDRLQLTAGEFVSVVGASGCGKSTLLRIIAGLLPPASGSVEYPASPHRQRPRTGFVFQEATLLPWRNSESNIQLPGELQGTRISSSRVRKLAALVGLSPDDLRKRPAALSGGMKMRVSLARALALEPELLLLDEPFAAVDDLLRQQLQTDVLRIQKNLRLSTILVTHNVQEAVYMSDRVLVLGGTPAGIVHECCAEPENTSAHEVRTTPEFASCTRQILSALRASAGESPPSDPARSGIW